MAKNASASALNIPIPNLKLEEEDLVAVRDFLAGLITDYDPTQIPDNALTQALNLEYIRGMLFRRNGLRTYAITKPNSNKVMAITATYQQTTGLNLIRADKEKLHRARSNGWEEYTPNPAGIALSGGDFDYFGFTTIDDRIFFTNNGVDPIRELDPVAMEYIALGNAPKYKYIVAAFDRVIGASLIDAVNIPVQVGGSGNRNYDEWDPTVDISAFENTLVDSPSDVSDDITGLLFSANSLIIPRQRSIWIGTHLDSATNPFRYFSAVPAVGADLPRTIKLTNHGLVWASFQNSCLFIWDLQSQTPNKLESIKISRYLKTLIQSAFEIWASYSADLDKYSLFLSYSGSSTVTCITYDFNYKNFLIQEYPLVSIVDDIDFSSSSITIDELSGAIADLIGPIDSLGGLIGDSTRFFGHTNGEMSVYSFFSGLEDSALIYTDDLDGTAFSSDLQTKEFEIDPTDQEVSLVRFPFVPYTEGTITLQYSRNGGSTWIDAKSFTVTAAMLEQHQIFQLRKAIKSRSIIWRLTTSDVMMSHNGLIAKTVKSGVSKNGSLG